MKRIIIGMFCVLILTGCSEDKSQKSHGSTSSENNTTKKIEDNTEDKHESTENRIVVKPLTTAEQNYTDAIGKTLTAYYEDYDIITTLLDQTETEPHIIYTQEWTKAFEDNMLSVVGLGLYLEDLKEKGYVPDRFLTIHKKILKSLKYTTIGCSNVLKAIETNDKSLTNIAAKNIIKSGDILESINEDLDKIVNDATITTK